MPTTIEIEAQGLALLRDRFAHAVGQTTRTRLSRGMHADAAALKDVLQRTAPRSPRPATTHLADAFTVGLVKMQGATFSVSIGNAKVVTSKSGVRWSLLDIVTQGWGKGHTPNPFVQNALHGDVTRHSRQAAGQVATSISSGTGPL
jgi:hypothetical protein